MSEQSETLAENVQEKEEPPSLGSFVLRHEKTRFMIICWSLLAMVLAFVIFLFTSNVFPVFFTMVFTFLGYKHLDTSLKKSERAQEKHNVIDLLT